MSSFWVVMRLDKWDSFDVPLFPGIPVKGVDKSVGILLVYDSKEAAEENNPGFPVMQIQSKEADDE